MTTALVFVTEPIGAEPNRPAAGLTVAGETVLDRVCRQLGELGADRCVIVARPRFVDGLNMPAHQVLASPGIGSDLDLIESTARSSSGPLLLCAGDVVANTIALGYALRAEMTTALTGRADDGTLHPGLRVQKSRAVSVATGYHSVTSPNASFRGVLTVATADLGALATACASMRDLAAQLGRTPAELAGPGGAAGLVLLAMVRSGTTVATRAVRLLTCDRVGDATSLEVAVTRLMSTDEQAARLRLAVKEHDDFFATYFVSSYSPWLVAWLARRRLTPTMVTWISVAVVAAAAGCFSWGIRPTNVIGAVLLYVGFLFDCLDGQLARFTQHSSRFGGWLDTIADRAKEYAVYAGLAVGAARAGLDHTWALAAAAMVLQTVRHMTDAWYGGMQRQAVALTPRTPLASPVDALAAPAQGEPEPLASRVGQALGRVSAAMESTSRSPRYWIKRTVVFPIGERWLVCGLAVALFDGRVALIALLIFAALAFAYTLTGRALRGMAMRIPTMPAYGPTLHRDDGAIAWLLGWLGRGWARPLPAAVLAGLPAAVILILGTPLVHQVDLSVHGWVVFAAGLALLAGLGSGRSHDQPLDWLVPAALRFAELAVIVVAGLSAGVAWPLIYGLLGVVTLVAYDLTARVDQSMSPLRARWLLLGWDVRIVIVAAGAVLGVGPVVFAVLAAYLALVFVAGSVAGLLRSRRPAARIAVPSAQQQEPPPVAGIPEQSSQQRTARASTGASA